MKYFLDTEFIEGFHKPFLGKRRHFIDLISIGIVAEDGREYYAISNEFNPKDASEWVRKNVIEKLEYPRSSEIVGGNRVYTGWEAVKKIGKSNKQIAKEIIEFINPDLGWPVMSYNNSELKPGGKLFDHFEKHNVNGFTIKQLINGSLNDITYYFAQPEFYAYFADYDWVLFCSLFGTMMQLPKGFPMYCRDLKQMLDEAANALHYSNKEKALKSIKSQAGYPQQTNEHNALADAKWDFELYKFLTTI